jgi:hypothetical protein
MFERHKNRMIRNRGRDDTFCYGISKRRPCVDPEIRPCHL